MLNKLQTFIVYIVIASVGSVFFFPFSVNAQEIIADHPILYLFWGHGCPHCEKEKEYLKDIQESYPELEIRLFEVWDDVENRKFAQAMRQAYDAKTSSVPMTFLGRWTITGFRNAETTGKQIEQQIEQCLQQGCIDALTMLGPNKFVLSIRDQIRQDAVMNWERIPPKATPRPVSTEPTAETSPAISQANAQDSQTVSPQATTTPIPEDLVSLPVLGDITVSAIGLPLFTLIIGGLDGFNPCAMWVLSFLLTLVIYAKSRGKILLIGGIFVIASGVIYFMFMVAWLNIFMFVRFVTPLRVTVALVAIVMGLINCKDFFFFKQGFSLTIPESAQPKLFKKMRALVQTTAVPAIILGTIVLAVTANLIELLCTAGFPAIYTRILTLQEELSVVQYYFYLILYNVVYVIPLATIVGVFAWKMGGRKMSEKEGRILKLVGGVLMLALGVILLVNPQILMFG
jgi:thiol-disulfide isomerase/thioredoxin